MSKQETSPSSMTIKLEIVPEDPNQQDIAYIDEIGRSVVDFIRENKHTVTPVYTGKMGGPLYDVFIQAYMILQSNREILATTAATIECILVTLKLIKYRAECNEKVNINHFLPPLGVEITIPTTDGPWIIKAPNAESAIEVVQQLPITSNEKVKKVTHHDKAKVTLIVSKRKPYRAH